MLKIVGTSLALAILTLLATNCGTDHAQIRIVHASPDAPNVDVAVDGTTDITNLSFASSSNYMTVTAGNRRLEVRTTGTTTDLVNAFNVSFSNGKQNTVFFTGRVNPPPPASPNQTINPVTDDNSAPPSGSIKLRFFHASPSGPASVDVYVVAPGTDISSLSPSISSLAYQQASGYLSVTAGSHEIIVTAAGGKTRLIDQTPSAFSAGQIRTFVVLDVAGGGALSTTVLQLTDLG